MGSILSKLAILSIIILSFIPLISSQVAVLVNDPNVGVSGAIFGLTIIILACGFLFYMINRVSNNKL